MKSIPNFSRYFATDEGFIFTTGWRGSKQTKQIKAASDTKDGYLQSMFKRDDGKYCTVKIHKLIALAYFGERVEGQEINHKNGIKTDNRPENLEYCSRSENVKHAFDMGLLIPKRGESNGNSKLSTEDVNNIREAANCGKRYYGRKGLAIKYGVSEAHIKDIVTRRRNVWGHLK